MFLPAPPTLWCIQERVALIRQHYEADKEKLQKIRVLLVRPGVLFTCWHFSLAPFPGLACFFCLSVCLFICLFAFCIICFHVYSAKCKPKSKNQRGGGPGNDENKGTFLCHIGGQGVFSLSEGVKIHEKLGENCLWRVVNKAVQTLRRKLQTKICGFQPLNFAQWLISVLLFWSSLGSQESWNSSASAEDWWGAISYRAGTVPAQVHWALQPRCVEMLLNVVFSPCPIVWWCTPIGSILS